MRTMTLLSMMALSILVGCGRSPEGDHRSQAPTTSQPSPAMPQPSPSKEEQETTTTSQPEQPGAKVNTSVGRVTVVKTEGQITGVMGPPGEWRLGDVPMFGASIKPDEGKAWLVVQFQERRKEFSFKLSDLKLTIPGKAASIKCWSASADAGKHFLIDITKQAPAEEARVVGEGIIPAVAFEIPANAKSGVLRVNDKNVPLRW